MIIMMGFFGPGLASVPFGVPPLPEDQVVWRVAPDECLYYFSSAGMAEPDPESSNNAEKLLAEEDIRKLVTTVEKRILEAIEK